jgi:pimeloyl-ACP methyl ester carboxylesterase
VDRLALAATNVFTDTRVPLPLRVAGVPLLGDLAFRLAVGNRVGLWLLYRAAVGQKGTATWPRFRRHLTPSGVTSTRRIFRRSLADLEANYAAVEETLSEVRVPGLVLWGDSDPFFPREVAERTRAALPDSDAELIVYDRTGHFVPEERPGAVASALREFLRPG